MHYRGNAFSINLLLHAYSMLTISKLSIYLLSITGRFYRQREGFNRLDKDIAEQNIIYICFLLLALSAISLFTAALMVGKASYCFQVEVLREVHFMAS